MARHFRFSLLNALLVVAVTACGMALYYKDARLRQLEADVDRLRREAGYLSIEDPDQLHGIAVPQAGAYSWRWRIHLPGGHDYGLFGYRGGLSSTGMPDKGSLALRTRIGGQSSPLEDREVILDVALATAPEGGKYLAFAENDLEKGGIYFDNTLPTWADGGWGMFAGKEFGRQTTLTAPAAGPLKLLVLDALAPGGKTSEEAVVVWIADWQDASNAIKSFSETGSP